MGCRLLLLVVMIVVGMLVAAVVLVVDEMEGRAVAHALAHQHAQGQVVARRSEKKKKKGEKKRERALSPAGRRMVALEVGWGARSTKQVCACALIGGVCSAHNLMMRVVCEVVAVT